MTETEHGIEQKLESFNRLSSDLIESYRGLEQRANRLERQLEKSRQEKLLLADRLAVLIDSLPGAVLVLDAGKRVVQANSVADQWFGGKVMGASWAGLLDRCGASCSPDEHELNLRDGRIVSVFNSHIPDPGATGEQGTIVLLTDISFHRRLQAELERNRRLAMMGEMIARVAHQFRNPLSAALLYAEQIRAADNDAEMRKRWTDKVLGRLAMLDRMTSDMLEFVATDPVRGARTGLAELVDQVIELVEATRPTHAGFRYRVDPGLDNDNIRLHGDCHALGGAICNLVENGWQAGADRIELRFRPSRTGCGFFDILIRDNGPGIEPQLRERIFEPFFSGRRKGGTGLGLAVARSVFEAHGGELHLEQSDAEGTLFIARLPHMSVGELSAHAPGETTA